MKISAQMVKSLGQKIGGPTFLRSIGYWIKYTIWIGIAVHQRMNAQLQWDLNGCSTRLVGNKQDRVEIVKIDCCTYQFANVISHYFVSSRDSMRFFQF